ncbi:type IV pilus modification protein PilV [Desulfuromonas sp. CSMB_57]|uniref:type IV pilus modification protein PilV n=1 Tax=Desulfuromonas sp. CSMB_57 TaxID=2807629 RepID=UPI001CD442D9|nr:type IV pilus modification protein PilV [Desulfuromonas sp. CSMB_57]
MSLRLHNAAVGRRYSQESGFSLVEVLVALMILTVGLLGLAGLQGRGLRDSQSALVRSRAVQCAEDILDRMRANRANAGAYAVGIGAPGPDEWDDMDGLLAELSGYAGIVQTDLGEWKFSLAQSLPEGDGSVAVNGNLTTVVVQWTESGEAQTVTVVTRL